MSKRRDVATAGLVVEYLDGSREIAWSDGVRRRYSRREIADLFIEACEQGTTNPVLDRLLSKAEMEDMYEALCQVVVEGTAVPPMPKLGSAST